MITWGWRFWESGEGAVALCEVAAQAAVNAETRMGRSIAVSPSGVVRDMDLGFVRPSAWFSRPAARR
jgi:hypothetical protein